MSDDVTTAATIASLRAEVERLTNAVRRECDRRIEETEQLRCELEGQEAIRKMREAELNAVRLALDERNAYAERLLSENVRLSNEAATARERAGVLERECRIFRERYIEKCEFGAGTISHTMWYSALAKELETAMAETDRTHALDAAKFGGAT